MYSQIMICASFAVASYQDFKTRSVWDLVWVPALVGVGYAFIASYPAIDFLLIKVALVGVVALSFTFFGFIGQADGIALAFIGADPFPLSIIPSLVGAMIVLLGHLGYNRAFGKASGGLTLPVEQFLKEQQWIPKAVIVDGKRKELDRDVNVARDLVEKDQEAGAMVEVEYGVPTVAYLGIGYILYVVYLIAFNPAAFFALP